MAIQAERIDASGFEFRCIEAAKALLGNVFDLRPETVARAGALPPRPFGRVTGSDGRMISTDAAGPPTGGPTPISDRTRS